LSRGEEIAGGAGEARGAARPCGHARGKI
jgi:hypothetical protein